MAGDYSRTSTSINVAFSFHNTFTEDYDHSQEEQSSWTSYFEDDHLSCFSSSSIDQSLSSDLVSSDASMENNPFGNLGLLNKRRKIMETYIDDELEDTASSSPN
ncbi:vascular-related unknown protein 4-like [Impatiens glandulifera]|uniref:vascular-related unknown protein 4-like n=1 Tax=Impatiens glandulifera TaxID=253017 RepID=UPI001FB13A7B|nr:vascular-related unknown protein 4-like [Impatiens glandulifera]